MALEVAELTAEAEEEGAELLIAAAEEDSLEGEEEPPPPQLASKAETDKSKKQCLDANFIRGSPSSIKVGRNYIAFKVLS